MLLTGLHSHGDFWSEMLSDEIMYIKPGTSTGENHPGFPRAFANAKQIRFWDDRLRAILPRNQDIRVIHLFDLAADAVSPLLNKNVVRSVRYLSQAIPLVI